MKYVQHPFKYILLVVLLSISASACKKNNTNNPSNNGGGTNNTNSITEKMRGVSTSGTADEKVLDTLYLAALNIYYWNQLLPSYTDFNPRKYTGSNLLGKMEATLFGITNYAANASNLAEKYENIGNATKPKYSYIDDISTNGSSSNATGITSEITLEGQGDDLGFRFGNIIDIISATQNGSTKPTAVLYLSIVYPGSNAKENGLNRGNIITKINNDVIDSYITYSNNSASLSNENSIKLNQIINNALKSTSVTLGIYDSTTQTSKDITISKTKYTSSPVLKYSIIDANGKKVGYLAYDSFQIIDNSNTSKAEIDKAFAYFEQNGAGMEDFIFDIRYNGGGYVDAAEYIMNKWAAKQQNGKVMFKEIFNTHLQNNTADNFISKINASNGSSLTPISRYDFSIENNTLKFNISQGSLSNLKNIYFLVTNATASAAELTYNSMKPYANCILIGQKTYGKPVGFFPVRIGGKDVYFSLFESKNSKDEGQYYAGITPNYTRTENFKHDFGDENEYYIQTALNLIKGGTEATTEARRADSHSHTYTQEIITNRSNTNYGSMIINPKRLKLLPNK